MSAITHADATTFESEITGQETPVLLFFHDPVNELCQFMNILIKDIASQRGDALKIVALDITRNQYIADALSLPEPPVFMFLHADLIRSYHVGKLTAEKLAAFVDSAATAQTGVTLDEFMANLRTLEQRQERKDTERFQATRRKAFIANAINIIGGIAITTAFPLSGFGLLGAVIAGYNGLRLFGLMQDKTKASGVSRALPLRILEGGANLATMAGSFGLIALALAMAAPVAAAGVAVGSFMIVNAGLRIGKLLPEQLQYWSRFYSRNVYKNAAAIQNRDPDNPLKEFSPPKLQAEPAPQNKASMPLVGGGSIKQTFMGGTTVPQASNNSGSNNDPAGPQPR